MFETAAKYFAFHALGRDAFHRVRFFVSQVADAVERIPTQWFMVGLRTKQPPQKFQDKE